MICGKNSLPNLALLINFAFSPLSGNTCYLNALGVASYTENYKFYKKINIVVLQFLRRFQFGWVATPDLANSIAMSDIPTPYLIVVNSTTNHHHIPDDEPHTLSEDAIHDFLHSILNDTAPVRNLQIFVVVSAFGGVIPILLLLN